MNNIKEYREKEQKMYIIANIFVLILFSNISDVVSFQDERFDILIKLFDTALLSSIIYIFSFLTDSLFSSGLKMKLLYLTGHLPGETIFSKLKNRNRDLRFSTGQLFEKYKEIYDSLPTDKKKKYQYENEHWYGIYNKHRDVSMIFVSNKDYLLCRDLYISTIIIFVCYAISCSLIHVFEWNLGCIIYLIFMLLVTNISAHIKGRRFAINVLAYDLHNFDETKLHM